MTCPNCKISISREGEHSHYPGFPMVACGLAAFLRGFGAGFAGASAVATLCFFARRAGEN